MLDIGELQAEIEVLEKTLIERRIKVGGFVYTATLNGYPAYGNWTLTSQGRFHVGYSTTTAPFNTIGATGGTATLTLLQHTHTGTASTISSASTTSAASTTGSAGHTHSGTTGAKSGTHVHGYGVDQDGFSGSYGVGGNSNSSAVSTSANTSNHTHTVTLAAADSHTHTVAIALSAHTHTVASTTAGDAVAANNNLPPYKVLYIYRRTS